MLQYILVGILLIWAVYFLVKSVKNQFGAKSTCASNCKCGIDFNEINADLKSK